MVKGDPKKAAEIVSFIDTIFANEGRKRVIGAICGGIGITFTALGLIILTTPIE